MSIKYASLTTLTSLVENIDSKFALKTALPTKVGDLTNDKGYQTASEVSAAIAEKVSTVYKPAGSAAAPDPTKLTSKNEGNVYNITAEFTTTDKFVEGTGKKYPAGTNIVVIKVEDNYLFDVLAGVVELDGYVQKVDTPAAGNLAALKSDGSIEDSGKKPADFVAAEEGKRLMTTAEAGKLAAISEEATKTEASETNGNIKIDGEEVPVYTLPSDVAKTTDFVEITSAEIDALFNKQE